MKIHKATLAFLIEQILGILCLYLAYFIGLNFPRLFNLIAALILGIATTVIYVIFCKKDENGIMERGKNFENFAPLIFSFASGLAVAAYFCKVNNNFPSNYVIPLFAFAIIFVNFIILSFNTNKIYVFFNLLSTLLVLGILAITIYCFIKWKTSILYRECALVFIYLFICMLGQTLYVWFGGDYKHKMNLSFSAAFFILFFIVLVIITEGDALDGIDGVIDGSEFSGGKSNKKIKYHR